VFEQVVFAGGGHRCWWQAGFWDVVSPEVGLRPSVIAGVSAGAAMACLLYGNNSRDALDYYHERLKPGARNAYWSNLTRRGKPVFPHAEIYRQALKVLLGGDHYVQLMAKAPEIRISFARIPSWLGPRTAVLTGMAAYNFEKHTRRPLHPSYGRKLGFKSEVVRIQDCKNEDDLISLIMASSCTPPFTPIEYRDGRPTMDGGMVDNVPVDAVHAERSTLVLTSRCYKQHAPVFMRHGRVYVQPSVKPASSSWDYTRPDHYEDTYKLGRMDGHQFLMNFALKKRPTFSDRAA
jgi:predicted acylesterase/phospholipase RssA